MAEFYDGPHATPPPAEDGPIFLGIKNMTEDGHLDLSEVRHISESDYVTWTRRVEPRPGDLVFTYEASLNRYAILPAGFRGCLGRRVALLRPDPRVADTKYVLYAFIGPEWRRTVQARLNIGATVDRLPLGDFPNFPIRLPPLHIQRKIASALSAYDDLIENNRRRVELLEEVAQRTYREWFVDFRYPGCRARPPRTSASEKSLPQGWHITSLGAIADWFSGGTPPTGDGRYWGGDIPWITSGSLTAHYLSSSERTLTELGARVGSRIVPRDAILFVVRGMSLAKEFRVGIADRPLAFGQDCKALCIHDQLQPLLVLHSLLDRAPQIAKMVEYAAHGTGKISTDRLKKLPVIVPPQDLQERFGSLAADVRGEIDLLNQSLVRSTPRTSTFRLRSRPRERDPASVHRGCGGREAGHRTLR
jgi:type I restriction enzyme, S subunit